MFGASLLKIFSFLKDGGGFSGPEAIYLFVGMVVSFAVSIIVIRFLMSFIKNMISNHLEFTELYWD